MLIRIALRGLRCDAWLGRSRLVIDLPSSLSPSSWPSIPLLRSPLSALASCSLCSFCLFDSAVLLLPFICASPSTALARAGRLLQQRLYRSGAIQSKLSQRQRVVLPLRDGGIGRSQPLYVPAIL